MTRASGIDLIVTDLDGTLWWSEHAIHPAVSAAWAELSDLGIPVLAASGRRIQSMRIALGRHGLASPIVALNGAIGVHLGSDSPFHRRAFEPAVANRVLDAFRAASLEPCVYVDQAGIDVYVSERPSTHPEHIRNLGGAVGSGDLVQVISTLPVLAFGLVGCPIGPLSLVLEKVQGLANAYLDRAFGFDGGSLMVAPHDVTKWDGVAAFCAGSGLDDARVLAIGDGANDLELLRNATVAISLVGSHPSALALADYVVPAADEGGWARLLDHL